MKNTNSVHCGQSREEQLDQSLSSVASTIIDSWDDWDGEAQQAAQLEQSDVAYRQVMMDHVAGAMRRASRQAADEPD